MANVVTVEANNLLNGSSGLTFTVASVTTTNASASATVVSGGFPNVAIGAYVSGTGIASGTQVKAISGNTLTLSQNATASGTVTLTFSGHAAPINPVQVALTTTTGTATAAGTEVVGGSYARQNNGFAVSAAGSISSNVALTYTNMPAVTVTAVDEYDSATVPVRRWFGALTASKTTNAGDTFSIASGSYTKTEG